MKTFDTVTLTLVSPTHTGWLVVRAQRSNRAASSAFRDAAAGCPLRKRNTSSHSIGRREKRVDTRDTMLLLL